MKEKFVPYEKLSKRKRREMDAQKRSTWGGCSPVTKVEPDSRKYRRHEKHRKNQLPED